MIDNPSFKIATFNANSIRSRLNIILDWLDKEKPHVLAVQETKTQDKDFPAGAFKDNGWNAAFIGQKSYNGVAFLSREHLKIICARLHPEEPEEEARFMHAEYNGVHLINTYVPQGYLIDSPKYEKKLRFFSDLKNYFSKNLNGSADALWMGDFNVAPSPIDLANPESNKNHVCFHIDARIALQNTMEGLWTDLFREKEKGPGHYTFWDYRSGTAFDKNIGWRVDHIFGTNSMSQKLQSIRIDREPRKAEKPSDHTFVIAEFSL